MKSSFHSLIPFLPLFCNCQFRRLDSVQFLCSQAHVLAGWRLELDSVLILSFSTSLCYRTLLYNNFARNPQKTASVVKKACLMIRCLAMDVLFLRALARAGMCLPSRCLAMGIHVTISMMAGRICGDF
jgi:hypothetical protein